MKTILTGLRPTGNLHLGHYFGACQNWVKMQNDYDFYLEIADVQALTDNFNNPDKVRTNVFEITKDLLALGLDPNKVNFFIQSKIPEIAELTIFYSNLVTVARLERNPTVKTEIAQKKSLFGNNGESITYGFLGYPVSQAADITAFDGECVPVGDDQIPLIEQCREIVRKFNSIYGETLREPEQVLSNNPRIKGLDGNEKMGKSLGNAIYLIDSDEVIKEKGIAYIKTAFHGPRSSWFFDGGYNTGFSGFHTSYSQTYDGKLIRLGGSTKPIAKLDVKFYKGWIGW